ncbi:unnamed protein product, partial [Mesorhabditis belari]|uniref:Uncharacterized protein n=1 Tax=Mesorhabditis belari TaxID=2138241 RepID=A0AAF3J3Z7_9BILA
MGTFTVSYWARKFWWEQRYLWAASAVAFYYGTCWDNAGTHKASMMKGHSRMFADRRQQILASNPHADVWRS